ncbi:MAG: tyrosine--tRNA ligase [Candidatus Yanofskybacteria bacterium RIFCSPHIGHO2_01_FULL_42_12]|uniref:Tyrosine--tRNA ligase n=1 Tax=Candidatus Yanofskybacteria bacterium RIFCSPLOWO2_01_FULL_42_49 TaxID=1802694 RepID=A0A1F8GEP4_9BACT|nr:MAG: tyrosine--tRNA ligase [Candidatus Yanofskybacteria bacterium RIFCSPHIGHO2_01_FULL_42_12]OGN23196.1 MAG: tyrosine--tRNA ligase [Candidatus Yanofskybacteria bacterium RIFCSPLOWO2_01_FULL_42_49]
MFGNKTIIDEQKIEELLTRRIEAVFPSKEEARNRLKEGKALRVYLGIDPTGPDLHLGHTIPLLFLKQLLELGHKPVLVIGDFTARIGDPTDKESTRKPLTEKEVKGNMRNYLEQVYKIIPKGSFEVKYNSSWLSKMSFEEVLKLASSATVQQMIARDMFQERLKNEKPIGIHEFLYPLMQGYDSVAMKVDGEVGGNDQTFNMLVGRDLEKKMLNKDKLVFATKLLIDAESGKKMSKTEGGLISLSDSPQDMFGKTMKTVPDEMTATVFELCTEKPTQWIQDKKSSDPYEFKKKLAFELVRMYHGEKEAQKAKDEWERVFSRGELPSEMEEVKTAKLVELVGLVTQGSSSSAKILIDQGAVKVNGEVKKEWNFTPKEGDIIQIGPKKFVKVAR